MDAKYLAEIKARCEGDVPDIAAPVFRDRKALIAEVERLTDQHQCDTHNLEAMQTILDQQAKNCENLLAAKDQQIATLKAELQDSHQDHIDDFMRLKTEIATLKEALEIMAMDLYECDDLSNPAIQNALENYIHQASEQEGKK